MDRDVAEMEAGSRDQQSHVCDAIHIDMKSWGGLPINIKDPPINQHMFQEENDGKLHLHSYIFFRKDHPSVLKRNLTVCGGLTVLAMEVLEMGWWDTNTY